MRPISVSKALTVSPTNKRLEGTPSQHRSIISHTRSEMLWLSGRGGLAPLSIEYVAAGSLISENGGRPVRTCPE